MAVDSYRVVIKPNGVLLIGIAAAVILGVTVVQISGRMNSGQKPVGGAPPAATNAAAAPDDEMTPPEREEKEMLVNWNKEPGQARDWLFLGPLSSGSQITTMGNDADAQAQMDRTINTVYLPQEAKYQAKENASFNLEGKNFSWRKFNGSAFDFKNIFTTPETPISSLKNVVVYGVTYIDSPKAQKKVIRFRSDDGAIVWLNGDQVFKTTKIRGVREEDTIPINLRPGKNTLLIKVGQGSGGWGMMVHMEDAS
jgi:hypothetical protein